MAVIRGKPAPASRTAQTGGKRGGLKKGSDNKAALQKTLGNAGLLVGGKDPKAVAKSIVANLAAMGFGADGGLGLLAQLKQSLVQAQGAHGLAKTGELDKATLNLLNNLGVLLAASGAGLHGMQDSFEGGKKEMALTKQAAPQVPAKADAGKSGDQASQLAKKLTQVLERFFGATGAQIGEQLGQLVQALVARINPEAAQAQAPQNPAQADAQAQAIVYKATDGDANTKAKGGASEAKESSKQRSDSQKGEQQNGERGLQDEEGDPDAVEGEGGKEGKKAGRRGGDAHSGAESEGEGEGDGEGDADEAGRERRTGTGHAGDWDLDNEKRGHASMDDGSDDLPGHYKIPTLKEQVDMALLNILKEPARPNRPDTYSLDITFFKPGIYGPHQPAQDLFHLVVNDAAPSDPVWQRARNVVANLMMKHGERDHVPTVDDFKDAMSRAKVRAE
jgi:hypothetical protein